MSVRKTRKKDDAYFMGFALKEAKASLSRGGIPIGAAIVFDNTVVAVGRRHNNDHAYLDHAETRALRTAYKKIGRVGKEVTVYTTLEPCIMCFGTMLHGRVKKIVYALGDPYGGATKMKTSALPLRHRTQYPKIKKGVLAKESAILFELFLRRTKNPFWRNENNELIQHIRKINGKKAE